jgi:ribosome-associated protein YbcJ (S4-like RNA binding protein)
MAKWFLSEHEVFVNGESEDRRGRKLRTGDQVDIPTVGQFVVS